MDSPPWITDFFNEDSEFIDFDLRCIPETRRKRLVKIFASVARSYFVGKIIGTIVILNQDQR